VIVIADSSALIALSICNVLDLLIPLFGEIKVPVAVFEEVCIENKPEFEVLKNFLEDKVSVTSINISTIEKSKGLGLGELEAIALYKDLQADLLLIDDARAKKVAYTNNLEVMGSLGVLLLAKQQGLIDHIYPLLKRLKYSDIFISHSLLDQVLVMAGENGKLTE
jgi:predicted nucleic acid-binding protein